MNSLVCLIALTLTLTPAFLSESFPVTTSYDRESDVTTDRIELHNDDSAPTSLTLYANAAFRGRKPNGSVRFWFTISVTRGKATRKTPPLLDAQQPLHLSFDDTQLDAPLTEHRKEYYELARRISESAQAEFAHADLQKLLATKQLYGQCGTLEFKLSAGALVALKDFITQRAYVK